MLSTCWPPLVRGFQGSLELTATVLHKTHSRPHQHYPQLPYPATCTFTLGFELLDRGRGGIPASGTRCCLSRRKLTDVDRGWQGGGAINAILYRPLAVLDSPTGTSKPGANSLFAVVWAALSASQLAFFASRFQGATGALARQHSFNVQRYQHTRVHPLAVHPLLTSEVVCRTSWQSMAAGPGSGGAAPPGAGLPFEAIQGGTPPVLHVEAVQVQVSNGPRPCSITALP